MDGGTVSQEVVSREDQLVGKAGSLNYPIVLLWWVEVLILLGMR